MNPEPAFAAGVAVALGWYYVLAAVLNLTVAWRAWRRLIPQAAGNDTSPKRKRGARPFPSLALRAGVDGLISHRRWSRVLAAGAWLTMAAIFGLLAWRAWAGSPLEVPPAVKSALNAVVAPLSVFSGSLALLAILYLGRRFFVRPAVALGGLNASLVLLGASLADAQFARVALRPDNVPILVMAYLLGFFTWLATSKAVANDARRSGGQAPAEQGQVQRRLVWPDLVYIELIAMVLVTAGLLAWSQAVRAPLEPPANPALTPNPSKAPWYFLGFQELLGFFDPTVAGVILPGLIIAGLMSIPYLDRGPREEKGDTPHLPGPTSGRCPPYGCFAQMGTVPFFRGGYYTIAQRKPAYLIFQFGFLQLWILLILVGTFMRGPNWDFFGPYQSRDTQKPAAAAQHTLSHCFWVDALGRGLPQAAPGSGALARAAAILGRESPGIAVLAVYFLFLPPLLGRTLLGRLRRRMTFGRYAVLSLLSLMMLAVPLKMILHWTLHLSYVVGIPEYNLNF